MAAMSMAMGMVAMRGVARVLSMVVAVMVVAMMARSVQGSNKVLELWIRRDRSVILLHMMSCCAVMWRRELRCWVSSGRRRPRVRHHCTS